MTDTTSLGIPFPESTDAPRGNEQMQALAEAVDALLYRAFCVVKQSAAQSTGSSGSTCIFNFDGADDYDPLDWHDPSTNNDRVTPTIPGDYKVTVEPVLQGTNTVASAFSAVYKNGTRVSRSGNVKPGTSATSAALPTYIDVVSCNGTTDYIQGACSVSTSATEQTNPASNNTGITRMLVEYIGPTPA